MTFMLHNRALNFNLGRFGFNLGSYYEMSSGDVEKSLGLWDRVDFFALIHPVHYAPILTKFIII